MSYTTCHTEGKARSISKDSPSLAESRRRESPLIPPPLREDFVFVPPHFAREPLPKPLPQGEGLFFVSPSIARGFCLCSPSLAEGVRGWVICVAKSKIQSKSLDFVIWLLRLAFANPAD
ncbi:hypothetical protein [Campylobacter troglodytis]|uniref:hypothetical protein n=1 Tax=Campylobacter troglodytis TaxID=654363 RepID=UPI001159B801|nr:hypothetical protein [Campylobacter troglodytis]TQR60779.1 hypothetical protein DMC01_03975 [Campylobacter troglodytis]